MARKKAEKTVRSVPPAVMAGQSKTYQYDQWAVIGRGQNGWHAATMNGGCSSSGGTLEDRPWHDGQVQKGYVSTAREGCVVYDASGANCEAFMRHVISGPMLKMGIESERFTDHETAARMLPALEGGYATVIKMALSGYSSLDYVGWPIFRALLEKIGGVKFGVVHHGQVVWETNEPDESHDDQDMFPPGHNKNRPLTARKDT